MKKVSTMAAAVLVLLAAGNVFAISQGKSVEWQTPMGKVTFKGDDHAGKGLKCSECHPKIFKMKKGSAKFTMTDINDGKFCGTCHNGTKAFAPKDNCAKCHVKEK